MKLYKILKGLQSCHGGAYTYPEPKDGQPGEPTPRLPRIKACERGYHLVDTAHIVDWINDDGLTIWEAEPIDCEPRPHGKPPDKYVCSQVRLVAKVGDLTDTVLRLWGCDCAEDVLPIYEMEHTEDRRPRTAVETARRYTVGEATNEELDAAWAAAGAAAWAAGAAEWAAGAAEWAAGAAEWAAGAAEWAAWAAARDAARAAAWNAARAAGATASQRYGQLLIDRLKGEK